MNSFIEVLSKTMKYASENLEDASDKRPIVNMCRFQTLKRCARIAAMIEYGRQLYKESLEYQHAINRMLIHKEKDPYKRLEMMINEEACYQSNRLRNAVHGDGTKY